MLPARLSCICAVAVLAAAMGACGGGGGGGGRDRPSEAAPRASSRALQRVLDDVRRRDRGVGISAAFVEKGRLRWSGGSGVADLRTRAPVDGATVYAVASLTKTFIAAVALRLVEDGVVGLDEPVSRWLPSSELPAGVTLRRLLSHSSGLAAVQLDPAYNRAIEAAPSRRWTPRQTLRYVRRPSFAPGRGWQYANTNYILAALAIERAAGTSVAAQLHRLVLAPLGLHNAGLQPQDDPPAGTAHGHGDPQRSGTIRDVSRGMRWVPYNSVASSDWAAAGMFATAEDLAVFGDALFRGRLLTPASVKAMVDFLPAAFESYIGYGLGVGKRFSTDLGGEMWGSIGRTSGFRADVWHVPSRDITVVVAANDERFDTTQVADALLAPALTEDDAA